MNEVRCDSGHLQATIEDGVLYLACASCSHAARKAGKPSPVRHEYLLSALLSQASGIALTCDRAGIAQSDVVAIPERGRHHGQAPERHSL